MTPGTKRLGPYFLRCDLAEATKRFKKLYLAAATIKLHILTYSL